MGAWRNWTRRWQKTPNDAAAARSGPDTVEPAAAARPDMGQTVEREVIPRLLVAHQTTGAETEKPQRGAIESEVVAFARLVATHDAATASAWVESRRANGVSVESLFLGLLEPAARRLSSLWQEDRCHFDDIAVGLLNLQCVMHELSGAFASECQCRSRASKVLLISAPAEHSMLGVSMATDFYRCLVAEFFHRAGWEVWRSPPASRAELMNVLRSYWFDVVDVSASCEARLPRLSADVAEMRKVSRNARIGVSVGGPAFDEHLEFVEAIGADASASDPRDTLLNAEALVAMHQRKRDLASGVGS
ncbi:MAG TPA: cobalamin B12-binding domain-containing protein [Rhodanobacteraceae bacterium]